MSMGKDEKMGVRYYRDGGIGVVLIDNPPVNALSADVRAGLLRALEQFDADLYSAAIVIAASGGTFCAGADITEFGSPGRDPALRTIVERIATLSKPSVGALQGVALGGGLELAMACRFRIAAADARLGLPEIRLGFIPGAGGTVRLPRLVGPAKALELILSGDSVTAEEARSIGLVDAVFEGDPITEATNFLLHIGTPDREDGRTWPPSQDERAAFEAVAARMLEKRTAEDAARAAVDALRNALDMPFRRALAVEGDLFADLRRGNQSHALRHLFVAERKAVKLADVPSATRARPIARVGVVGAGTMGTGIAMAFANSGILVTMVDADIAALNRGLSMIARTYERSVAKGRLTKRDRDERLGLIQGSAAFDALSGCDLIIEAVVEDLAVKKEVFRQIDRVADSRTILATNTSYLDIAQIGQVTARQENLVGLHFFSPAHVMPLLEIVRTDQTSHEVLASVLGMAKLIGKKAVVVGVCHGFVGNRMLAARNAENEALLMEGASPEQIDKVFTDFGWPMGPFQMSDMAGLDIGWRNRKALGKSAPIADWLCAQGHFGQKSGQGFYRYEAGNRSPLPNPMLQQQIEMFAAAGRVSRRLISPEEILERTLFPMINEGRRILREGIARQSSDIDLVWVHGYGFPRFKGGPMFWASTQKLYDIEASLKSWYDRSGREHFRPSTA